ncbi:MAG TPA: TonB-dependent receptor [bacterium]|nr:TonB-dependent receptor [bacterium]
MFYRTVKKALLFVAVPLFCINNDSLLYAQTTSDSLHLSSTDTSTIRPDSAMVKPFPYRSVQHFFEKIDTTENIQRGDSSFRYTILPHDSLLHYYHEDFADMLMQITGTYLHDQGSYGKPISVTWSGLSNRHILILLDGMPLTEPDWGWTNLNYVSLETIDRIEVFRGNASVRYGAQAATGYINIVLRQADADKPLTSLKFRSVFDDFRDVGVFFGRNFGSRVQTYVGGSSRGTPGEQLAIGLSGGTLANFNSTRYSGKNIFFGGKVLIHENIALQIHRQIYTDRYDAYGRDRDPLKDEFDFSTRGAERKDERDDWQARLVVNNKAHMWTTEYQNTDIVRRSTGFTYRLVPRYYGVKNQTGEAFAGLGFELLEDSLE